VTDVLPAELVWDEASLVAPAGVTCDFAGQTLTCTIPAAQLTSGASVVITAEASAPADTAPGTYENAVVVDSPEDPDCVDGACAPPPTCPPADSNNAACTPVDVDTGRRVDREDGRPGRDGLGRHGDLHPGGVQRRPVRRRRT
jgi:hypothetical protein